MVLYRVYIILSACFQDFFSYLQLLKFYYVSWHGFLSNYIVWSFLSFVGLQSCCYLNSEMFSVIFVLKYCFSHSFPLLKSETLITQMLDLLLFSCRPQKLFKVYFGFQSIFIFVAQIGWILSFFLLLHRFHPHFSLLYYWVNPISFYFCNYNFSYLTSIFSFL